MPCFFCIAVIAIVAGIAAASAADEVEAKLGDVAASGVRRGVDTQSVARFDLEVLPGGGRAGSGGGAVPVAVTLYKAHSRVRIQVMSHAVPHATAHEVMERVAQALDGEIVTRSDVASETRVQQLARGAVAAPTDPTPRPTPDLRSR